MHANHARFLEEIAAVSLARAPFLYRPVDRSPFDEWALASFVVAEIATDIPIALVRLTGSNPRNRHASVELEVRDDRVDQQWLGEGIGLFLQYVFANWDLRKVYARSTTFRMESLPGAVSSRFELEGTLRAEYVHDGTLVDERLYAFYPGRLTELWSDGDWRSVDALEDAP